MRHKAGWQWVEDVPASWAFIGRVLLKAMVLFMLCNIVFASVYPMAWLGKLSLYGVVYPSRARLPYTDGVAQSSAYNLTLQNISAMFASHRISQVPIDTEFRVLLIGDSSVWGFLLSPDETVSSRINADNLVYNGEQVVAYNLGYPVESLTKDILLLDYAMQYEPDMILWLVTLESFAISQQVISPLVQQNAAEVERLVDTHNIRSVDMDSESFEMPDFMERTIVGQRVPLANLLRLQTYGVAWSATGIDHVMPETIPLRVNESELENTVSWAGYEPSDSLDANALAFDVLEAGIRIADNIPVIVVNQPIFISAGENSDVRYNSLYPRWAYDAYRVRMREAARDASWQYIDLWDVIAAEEFTDSPVHMTPTGTAQLANELITRLFSEE